ncbi:DUF4913 domain-containing protein [Dactylosporangium sucinum]|uniref:DUF4913 domain-containing protein n=1 Tax=Dactylosporangium sucinum TaxID=1424081 RepID=A0A917UHA0_9ACTN|nr:DUF4913 domain-containing protein [Dactylosporangium sucinum]GGM86305.1 hypothetical protein GCM10007977_105280 [Dactylosporangium sucinum]
MTGDLRPDELPSVVAALQTQVAELTQRLDDQAPTVLTQQAGTLKFPTVEAWVHGMFLPMFGWRVDGQRWHWCPQWWRHAEAIWRLETLWRSWEAARLIATGMSNWSVELDRQLRELLGEDGPFRQCRAAEDDRDARHAELPPAAAEPAPEGWWD